MRSSGIIEVLQKIAQLHLRFFASSLDERHVPMSDVTIYDVAEKAGVSIATVSNVINAPKRVKPATLTRVLAVIDELGFVPKAEAAVRARKGVGRIGVIAPFTTYPSFDQRLHGVIEALRGQPYELVIYDQESAALRQDYLASVPIARRLDGLIVMALPFHDAVANRLLSHGLETVLIECAHASFSSLEIDNAAGGRLAAEYLVARGHRRCAFVGERQVSGYYMSQSEQRLAGYRQGLAEAGIELLEDYVSLAPFGRDEARQQTHQLLDLATPPTAILAHSDIQAMGVLKAARERGVAVPADLAVIGFDDLDCADYIGLTTVHQPLIESGRIAVSLLLERLDNRSGPIQRVSLPLHVVQRETA
jgi:LacI family transcriptional regulator